MKVRLLLALHFHQPVGNFDSVLRDAVRLCYEPLVAHFERHPGVGAAFHLSGCLIEWLERHEPGLLDRVVALVDSGRIEPLGGGFYEPILSAIPRPDALEQMARLSDWWQKRAGRRPSGAWIAERVWEPSLPELLAEAGTAYTILDDQHLRFAGLLDERFGGVYSTERNGRAVAFFPSDFQLRYLLPFRTVEVVRSHLAELAAQGREWALTYGDDAEKFGLWPKTHAWVYGEGWLEKFLTLLEDPEGPARGQSPGAFLSGRPAARKVYVPNASYTEMLEWALPPESLAEYARARAGAAASSSAETARAFVRGPLWDMFLARYPEADQLHKHMLWTSRRTRALTAAGSGGPPPAEIRGAEAAQARTALLRAQCNCAYWHGLFGGIYFPHLRHGACACLLEADALLSADCGEGTRVEVEDLDGDLEPEVILRTRRAQAFLRPADGGTLAELDCLPARFNVTNVVSRWKESYHLGADQTHGGSAPASAVASPHEQSARLPASALEGRCFDTLPLRSLRDFRSRLRPASRSLASFEGLALLSGRPESWEKTADGLRLRVRLGSLAWTRSVRMEPGGALVVRWRLERPAGGHSSGGDASSGDLSRGNAGGGPAADEAGIRAGGGGGPAEVADEGWFGTLLFLSLLTPDAPDRALILDGGPPDGARGAPGAPVERDDLSRLRLEDRAFGFALEAAVSPAVRLVAAPIETVQRSEDRIEIAYQGTAFALCWPLGDLARAGGAAELRLEFVDL
jgi:alpha-amylase